MKKKKTRPNPFSLGGPIGASTEFIGRELLLQRLVNAMIRLQNISLLGERRTGKTSLLLHLSNSESFIGLPTEHIPVYFDFQAYVDATEEQIWQGISETIVIAMQEWLKEKSQLLKDLDTEITILTELPGTTNLRRLLRKLSVNGYSLHLLFDEFEQISGNKHIQRSFYSVLRSLATGQNSNVSYIIATRRPLSEIEPAMTGSAFFNIFATEYMPLFNQNEAWQLILEAFIRSDIENSKEKAKLLQANLSILQELTGYHPYFLQALCYRLFEHIDLPGWPSGAALARAIEDYIQETEPNLRDYWELSSKPEQDLLEKLASSSTPVWGGEESLAARDTLKRRGLILPTDEIQDKWIPFSTIFAEWIQGQHHVSSAFAQDYVNKRAGGSRRSVKILHVFTGSKGGVGKTLLALCAAVKSSTKGKVLCIDLNWENPDLSRILESIKISTFFASTADTDLNSSESKDLKSQRLDFQYTFVENILILRPPLRHILPSAAIGFWQSVRNALRESFEVHEFDPETVIVDTNMHFASLLRLGSTDTQSRVSDRINDLVREAQIRSLYIWYSWTLTSLNSKSEDPANMLRVLSWFDSTLEDYFFQRENLIHALNVFALHPPYLKDTNARTSSRILSFDSLAKLAVGNAVNLVDLVNLAGPLFEGRHLMQPKQRHEIIEELGKELLIQSEGKRPWNLFPIPVFHSNLAGFTDSMINENTNSIEAMKEIIQPIYQYVSAYLDTLPSNLARKSQTNDAPEAGV